MTYWLLASLGFMIGVGVQGFTLKLSLGRVAWPILVVATTASYIAIVLVLWVKGNLQFPHNIGWWSFAVVATGILTAGTFPLLATALEHGDVSKVIPISAGYPMVTVLLAFAFLSEPLSVAKVVGIISIVGGVVLLSR